MGRKGVSKRMKANVKAGPVSESISALIRRGPENQPEQVIEKTKAWPKDHKKR